jgi:hypothetical protein
LNGRNLAVGLVVGLLIGAAVAYAIAGPVASRRVTITSVTTATSISTSVSTQDITITTTPNSGTTASYSSIQTAGGYGSHVLHSSNNGWDFSVILNSLAVSSGSADTTIDVYVNLTYTANNPNYPEKVRMANPLINPVVYCSGGPACGGNSGQKVWAWNPPNVSLVNVTVYSGSWYFSGPYPVSLSGIQQSTYTLSIWPLIEPSGTTDGGYSIGQSLLINATLGQSLMINETIGVS